MKNSYNTKQVFVSACIGMCFFGIAMIVLGAMLPVLTERLSLTPIQATSLVAFLPIGMLAGSLLFGPVMDRYGYKTLLNTSCLLVLIGLEGIAFLKNVELLQVSILCIGFGGGILNGETNALVSDIYDNSKRQAHLSLLGAFYGIGALGIPVLLSFLTHYYSHENILAALGGLMLLLIIYCSSIKYPIAKQSSGFPIKESLKLLKNKTLVLLAFILFFQSGIEGISNNWTALYLTSSTVISKSDAMLTIIGMVAGLTITRLILIWLLKKTTAKTILISSLSLAIFGFLLLINPSYWRAFFGMICIGVGLSSTFPIILGIIGSSFSELSGTAFSIALTVALIGNNLLNNLVGLLSGAVGIACYPFIAIISLTIMLFLFTYSKREANIHL